MIDLAEIRRLAGMSQTDMARALRLSGKQGVSEIERRRDWLLSTFVAYIHAAGATVVISWPNGAEMEIDPE